MEQLRMRKTDLANVPVIPVPRGYTLRNYRPGDEQGIAEVYREADLGCTSKKALRERMLFDSCFTPERMFIVERAGEVVGTACAWVNEDVPGDGYLHMVGVRERHRGKRLGALVTVAAINYSRAEGFKAQTLDTDDWRTAAIKLYLDLGYLPVLRDDSQAARWQALSEKLGREIPVRPAAVRSR